VRDSGSQIRWAITVCTGGETRIRKFAAVLEPESQGIPYRRSWSGGLTGPGCNRWRMSTRDIWSEQVWYSRLTVVFASGALLRTGYKAFYID
jgi:hypothetical protein